MTVSVLVPYRAGCPWRERAWAWARARYPQDWEVIEGCSPDGPFSRAAAILDAAQRATGTVLVVADADVWCDPQNAIQRVYDGVPWVVPHALIHRLSPWSTEQVLAGADWEGLPLSDDNRQDRRPYRGNATGTLVVLHRDALEAAPPDPRFVGWGQEDEAWGLALRTLVGPGQRGPGQLVHLWHPPAARQTRHTGNPAGMALWRRYRAARGDRQAMLALTKEWT